MTITTKPARSRRRTPLAGRRTLASAGLLVVVPVMLSGLMGCSETFFEVAGIETPPQSPPSPGNPEHFPRRPNPNEGSEFIYLADASGRITAQVTFGSGPAWSPDGRRIAFQRGGQVRVINSDGSGDVLLTGGYEPTWSPDGTRIAFAGAHGISVINLDGSGLRTLVRHDFLDDTYKPWDMGVGQPAWSPDGKRIAFLHFGDGDTAPAQAFVVNSDGSNVRRLTRLPDRRYAESNPSWSPDGSKIAYWSYGYGIAVIDSDGGTPVGIYYDFPAVSYGAKPVWSPDGNTIAFTKRNVIWITYASGGGAEVLIPNGRDAAWSPDGTRIAFVRSVSAVTYDRVSPSGIPGSQRYVLFDPGFFSLQYEADDRFLVYSGRYSRSGARLAFTFDGGSVTGPWEAEGTISGDTMTVTYNLVMTLSDFEDGVFMQSLRGPP